MERFWAVLVLAVWTTAFTVETVSSEPLLISAFNCQVFGKSKMDEPEVVDVLVQMVQRYDIFMMQEIRDIDEIAFPELVDLVNQASPYTYGSLLGPREGRSSSKEQYGYIYRADRVEPTDYYPYNDAKDDFERPPFVVTFKRLDSGNQEYFNYIPLHAKPDDAINEINALDDVYRDSIDQTGITDAVIGGDLNADCDYVCSSCWNQVTLTADPPYRWLINSFADTTCKSTDCAYDRIIVMGDSMIANSYGAKIFRFDQEYNLSYEETIDVSDHYPVEFYLA